MNASHTTQGDTNIDITRRCLPRDAAGIRRSVDSDRVFNGHVAHFKAL